MVQCTIGGMLMQQDACCCTYTHAVDAVCTYSQRFARPCSCMHGTITPAVTEWTSQRERWQVGLHMHPPCVISCYTSYTTIHDRPTLYTTSMCIAALLSHLESQLAQEPQEWYTLKPPAART